MVVMDLFMARVALLNLFNQFLAILLLITGGLLLICAFISALTNSKKPEVYFNEPNGNEGQDIPVTVRLEESRETTAPGRKKSL
jgi:hypothetical protein